jgi:hypothetical protein
VDATLEELMHQEVISFGCGVAESDREIQLTPGKHVLDLLCDAGNGDDISLLLEVL